MTASMNGHTHLFPGPILAELEDGSSLLTDTAGLARFIKDQGYLYLKGLLPVGGVLAARRDLLERCKRTGRLKPGTRLRDGIVNPEPTMEKRVPVKPRPWPRAVQKLFEGRAKGEPIPWGNWIGPLFYWSLFILTTYFVTLCLLVVLRRQWVDRERLTFPLATLPLQMSAETEGRLLPPFLRNHLTWVGFSIPAVIGSINALHRYYNYIPWIDLNVVRSGNNPDNIYRIKYVWRFTVTIWA